MKKTILTLTGILIFNAFLFAQKPWFQKAAVGGDARLHAVCFSVNGKGYVGLGQNQSGTKMYDFWEFDPSANTWKQKTDYPGVGSYAPTGFSANGKGYICFGANAAGSPSNDLWEYTPSTDKWVKKADFPGAARYGASSFVIGDTAFIIGGTAGGSPYLFDTWMYIPAKNTWTQKADFLGGSRNLGVAFSIGKLGYAGTGLTGSAASADMYRYNKSTNVWSKIADVPASSMGGISFVIGSNGYVGTGYDLSNKLKDFYRFDVVTNSWTKLDSVPAAFNSRHAGVGFTINNIAYFGTGQSSSNNTVKDFWAYNPLGLARVKNVKNDPGVLKVYPNPVINLLNIETSFSTSEINLSLYGLNGNLIFQRQVMDNGVQLDLTSLSKGVYYLKIATDQTIEFRKVLKE